MRSGGFAGVLLRRSKPLHGTMWRQGRTYRADSTLLGWDRLLEVLEVALCLRWARLGENIVFQRSGLPIGGPVSDVVANMLLTLQESCWRNMRPWRESMGVQWRTSEECDEAWGCSRYVDGTLVLSRRACLSCARYLVPVRRGRRRREMAGSVA